MAPQVRWIGCKIEVIIDLSRMFQYRHRWWIMINSFRYRKPLTKSLSYVRLDEMSCCYIRETHNLMKLSSLHQHRCLTPTFTGTLITSFAVHLGEICVRKQ